MNKGMKVLVVIANILLIAAIALFVINFKGGTVDELRQIVESSASYYYKNTKKLYLIIAIFFALFLIASVVMAIRRRKKKTTHNSKLFIIANIQFFILFLFYRELITYFGIDPTNGIIKGITNYSSSNFEFFLFLSITLYVLHSILFLVASFVPYNSLKKEKMAYRPFSPWYYLFTALIIVILVFYAFFSYIGVSEVGYFINYFFNYLFNFKSSGWDGTHARNAMIIVVLIMISIGILISSIRRKRNIIAVLYLFASIMVASILYGKGETLISCINMNTTANASTLNAVAAFLLIPGFALFIAFSAGSIVESLISLFDKDEKVKLQYITKTQVEGIQSLLDSIDNPVDEADLEEDSEDDEVEETPEETLEETNEEVNEEPEEEKEEEVEETTTPEVIDEDPDAYDDEEDEEDEEELEVEEDEEEEEEEDELDTDDIEEDDSSDALKKRRELIRQRILAAKANSEEDEEPKEEITEEEITEEVVTEDEDQVAYENDDEDEEEYEDIDEVSDMYEESVKYDSEEEEPEDDDDDEEEEEDEEVDTPVDETLVDIEPTSKMPVIRAKAKPLKEKLLLLDDEKKERYNIIRNELQSYKKVHERLSSKGDTYRFHRDVVAKMSIAGKTLRLHLALNPKDFEDSKYSFTDLSEKRRYQYTPFTIKLRSKRSVKHSLELISMLATTFGLEKNPKYVEQDYISQIEIEEKTKGE